MSEAERRELVDSAYFMIEHGVKGMDVPPPSQWTVAQLESFELWTRAIPVPHAFVEHVTALLCSVAGMEERRATLAPPVHLLFGALWTDSSR